MQRWNELFIAGHKTFFIIVGLFGNFNLIYIVFSTPKLKMKSSLLQCVQSSAHIVCILNSFVDITLMVTDTKIARTTCFYLIFPCIFCFCVQTTIMMFILLDILLTVTCPIAMRGVPEWKYVAGMSMTPCLWGLAMVVWGFRMGVGEQQKMLTFCIPPLALHAAASDVFLKVTVVTNTVSLLIFLILMIVFQRKKSKHFETTKVMRHLKVSAALFIGSTYFSTFAANVLVFLGYSGDQFFDWMGNICITVMFAFSHTFYTIIWRSKEYRNRFVGLYSGRKAAGSVRVVTPRLMLSPIDPTDVA